MSSNLCIDLPALVRRENSCQIIDQIRESEISSVLFDWTACTDADKVSLCLLLNLIYECEEKGIKVRHASHEKNLYYAEQIKPFFVFQAKSLEAQETNPGAFIAAVDGEANLKARAAMLKNYLNAASVKESAAKQVETIFTELYGNIVQHSCAETGLAFVSVNAVESKLDIIVSDIGVGIPVNIKETFEEYEEKRDSEAIRLATKDLTEMKTDDQEYAGGLHAVCNLVTAAGGTVHLFSGNGIVDLNKKQNDLADINGYQPGTLIHIELDYRNL